MGDFKGARGTERRKIMKIFTIGRQFGSGGRIIGEELAKKLNIPFYDKDLLAIAAEKSGIHQELIEELDEKSSSSFLYSIMAGTYSLGNHLSTPVGMTLSDRIMQVYTDVINSIGEKHESCVIVGRCADYILRDKPEVLNIFIHASMSKRLERVRTKYGIEKATEETIKKVDKKRANYYNFYTNRNWGRPESYHLCLDSEKFGEQGCIDIILRSSELCL